MAKKAIKPSTGYCNPPEHTRFQKGVSGNPKGRPKGSSNLATILRKALSDTVEIQENGRRRRVSKLDAAVMQQVNKAVKGDARAFQLLLPLASMLDGQDRTPAASSAAEAAAVQILFKRLRGETSATSSVSAATATPSDPRTTSSKE